MSNHQRFRDEILAGYSPEERAEFDRLSEQVELGEQVRAARLAAKKIQRELAVAARLRESDRSAPTG